MLDELYFFDRAIVSIQGLATAIQAQENADEISNQIALELLRIAAEAKPAQDMAQPAYQVTPESLELAPGDLLIPMDEEDAGMAGHEDTKGNEPAETTPLSPQALAALEQWEGDAQAAVAAVYTRVFAGAPAVGLDTDAQFAELVGRVGDEDAWLLLKAEIRDAETRRAIDGKP